MKCLVAAISRRLSLFVRDRRGSSYLEMAVGLLVILSLVWCVVKLMPLYPTKQNIDFMANELVRTVELTGEVGTEYYVELTRLKAATRLNPSVTISANYIADNKIQLRERITITVSIVEQIEILTPLFTSPLMIDVPVSKTVTGMSEVYWKVT